MGDNAIFLSVGLEEVKLILTKMLNVMVYSVVWAPTYVYFKQMMILVVIHR